MAAFHYRGNSKMPCSSISGSRDSIASEFCQAELMNYALALKRTVMRSLWISSILISCPDQLRSTHDLLYAEDSASRHVPFVADATEVSVSPPHR